MLLLATAGCAADVGSSARPGSLPQIHDASGASRARVEALVRAAVDGLGFDRDSPEGPNEDDRVFVGRRYLAWIDQTGFYGKMNGLWLLDGAAGDALDFVVKDPDGRPVNALLPGENGEGRFGAAYQGAEHLEFPSRVPEPNDDPSCASSDWCNQYGLAEAVVITNPRIPWWSACNAGRPSFRTRFEPIIAEALPDGGLKLVYEGPVVKEADGDGRKDGDACHEDYLFPDGARRRVLLRVGYELHPDADHVDRTQQLVNPPGNPPLAGDLGLIGGFVVTAYPSPHYLKRYHRFWRPERATLQIQWNETVSLPVATWTSLAGRPRQAADVLAAWAAQPLSLSSEPAFALGRSITIDNVGPSDNADVGACLCLVHGGIELGGGLLHPGQSLPIAGGQTTIEARRRLTFPSGVAPGSVRASRLELLPSTGLPDALEAAAATDWGTGAVEAVFQLSVADVARDDVVIDLYDATAREILATRPIERQAWRRPNEPQRFTLEVSLDDRGGHALVPRVRWGHAPPVLASGVTVNVSER